MTSILLEPNRFVITWTQYALSWEMQDIDTIEAIHLYQALSLIVKCTLVWRLFITMITTVLLIAAVVSSQSYTPNAFQILSFGPFSRVYSPPHLTIFERTRNIANYIPLKILYIHQETLWGYSRTVETLRSMVTSDAELWGSYWSVLVTSGNSPPLLRASFLRCVAF